MFNSKFIERVNRLIEVQLTERRKQIPLEISRIKNEANAVGMLSSGRTILQIKDLCEREIEIRAVLAWKSLVRVINTLGYDSKDNLGNDLNEYINNSINTNFEELNQLLNQNLGRMKPEQVPMDEARNHVVSKHEIEIDLYIDTLKEQTEDSNPAVEPTHSYAFYGNVGTVQTGAGAQANVVQNIGADDQEALKQALSLASEAIQGATDIADTQKSELVEITNQAKNELEKEKPNSTMLQSMLVTIGTTIQTLASAKPAYLALKGALIPLGITLP